MNPSQHRKESSLPVRTHVFQVKSLGFSDMHDLTPTVRDALSKSDVTSGIVTVFVPGSTAGITTIEFESGAIDDLKRAIEQLAPQHIHYSHDARWGDGNGFSHVRAALMGPSLSIPFEEGKLHLGTWQQIILVDFDNRPRSREIILNIFGE